MNLDCFQDGDFLPKPSEPRSEKDIMATWVNDLENPILTIFCISYNHAEFISDALDGFLNQITDFPFEIIVHDDASTDGTQEIIKKYQKKYPNIIKAIFQKENQYSKGRRALSFFHGLSSAPYLAVCEGDDYWIDPLKLQKQVDFLEENEDCAASFHASQNVKETNNGEIITENSPSLIPKNNKYSTIDIIKLRGGNMSTNSLLFRSKHMHSLPEWYHEVLVGDLPLKLILAYKGDFGYIDRVMSCYRIEVKEGWTSQNLKNTKKRRKVIISIIVFWKRYNIYTKKSYKSEVRKAILGEYVLYVKVHIYYIAQRLGIK